MVMNKIAEDGHDYVALNWVKSEIVNNLGQAQNELESLVLESTSKDDVALGLANCYELLHQVSGALHMVGFPGAALFAEEIKALCNTLINNGVDNFNYSLQVLMQAVLQMSPYLDIIQTEGHDIPIALLPLINQMRECYKATPLSEVELFSQKYYGSSSPLTDEELKEINTEGLTNLLRKLRQSLQLSLIDLIHNRNFEIALDHLIKIFNYLGRLCKATAISMLWRVSQAFVIGINEKNIPNSSEVKSLLKQIDLQIRELVEQGVAGMNNSAPESLIKELLLLLAPIENGSVEIQKIKKEFQLTSSILDANDINPQQVRFSNIDRTALDSVIQALEEEFVFVKDRLDLFARSKTYSNADLVEVPDTLKRISNTLDILGLTNQKAIINKQLDIVNIAINDKLFNKMQAIDVAEALLGVENTVKNIVNDSSQTEAITAQNVVIKEVAYELLQVKEILSLYFDTSGEEGNIREAPALLTKIAGVLYIISQQRAAAVIVCCIKFIEKHLINGSAYPDNNVIDSIVGAIASIDYYLECLGKNQIVSAKDALSFAVKYLVELGYPLPEDYELLVTKFVSSSHLESAPVNDVEEEAAIEPVVDETKQIVSNMTDFETIDEEFVEIFSEEMDEIFNSLSLTLPSWINNGDKDSLIEVRRSFHTIKGSGRMVKATVIGELGWAIENMLNRVLDNTIPASEAVLEVVQQVVSILPSLIKEYASGQQHNREDVDHFSTVAHALANKQEPPIKKHLDSVTHERNEHSIVDNSEMITSPYSDELVTEEVLTSVEPIKVITEQEKEIKDDSQEFDVELIDIFIAEARTHMQTLKTFIALCERSLPQIVTDSLQRAMHTLKGSSLMASLDSIACIAKPFEGFLKECSINAWPIERTDLELLQDAYSLLNMGICQLELYSLAAVEGTDSLVERIRLRREYLLSQLEANITSELSSTEHDASPAELTSSLMQQVDLLLDAEENIREWQINPNQDFLYLAGLQVELKKVLTLALKANLKSITDLTTVLLKAYDALVVNAVNRGESFFTALIAVHQSLLNTIDQLAAAQLISEYPEEIAQLERVLLLGDNQEASALEEPEHEVKAVSVEDTGILKEPESESLLPANVPGASSTSEAVFFQEEKLILGAPAPKGPMIESDDIDSDMAEIFLEEADDIIEEARQDLDKWVEDQKPEYLKSLQRLLHTLKGGARMFGAKGLGDISHGLEFIYEGLLNGRYSYSADLVILLNKSHDFIQEVIDRLHSSTTLPNSPELLDAIQLFRKDGWVVLESLPNTVVSDEKIEGDGAHLEAYTSEATEVIQPIVAETKEEGSTPVLTEDVAVERSHISPFSAPISSNVIIEAQEVDDKGAKDDKQSISNERDKVAFKQTEVVKQKEKVIREPGREVAEQIKVSAELLDNLVNLAGETSIYRSRVEQQNSDLAGVLVEMDATVDRVRDQLRRLDMETQSQIISKHQTEASSNYSDFDPLEMDQYSQIQQLSRSLFESASDLQDLKDTLKRRNRDVETLLQQQGRINTELQEGLMRTRMVPLERIAPRLRRLVRQVSTELEKDVDLVIGNTAGEMDRGVIDAIVAPLEHMIRNSIDHGIESKEVRLAAGKPAKGSICLDLIREGGEMVLRLKDDGAGIPINVVREKAINKGLMSADEDLSDKDILQFILEAGFSTAKRVTQISGRGVGLDVVVNAVKQLGGALSLDSSEGKGTTFSIRLPINLSVSRALMIRVGEDSYAIPMSTVEGITYISQEQQKEFYQFGTAELEYGGDSYRVKYLGEMLGNQIPIQSQQLIEERAPVLLVRSGEHFMALRVDELLPSSEVVVKSLGAQFLSVPAISGATILGDGNVIIILDLSALVRSYFVNQQHQTRSEERRITVAEEAVAEPKRAPLVMVVDDSVTVRKVTTRLLERQGMQVITARDGLDAVTQLEERIPDIMLLDIEMPRMDGFEVATRVRHDEKTKHLPIIMITSRSGDKHRERALTIGVNEYMSKPFMDAKLVKSISDLLPSFEVNLLETSS